MGFYVNILGKNSPKCLVNFDNTKLLSKYWLIQRDRINDEQWFISHQAKTLKLKAKTTHTASSSIEA